METQTATTIEWLKPFAHRIHVVIDPVDLAQPVTLPDPWPRLIVRGFHADLLDRARAFMLLAERGNFVPEASEILRIAGEGFVRPFERAPFEPVAGDPFASIKRRSLDAIEQLSREFGDRVSASVWQTYAFMATRPEPLKSASILSQARWLPLPWWYADSVLHAMGKVYGLFLHLQSRMFEHTNMVFEHNCDCNHDIRPASDDGVVRCFIPRAKIMEATAAAFTHLLCEAKLIAVDALPFNLGLSPEAAEALRLDRVPVPAV